MKDLKILNSENGQLSIRRNDSPNPYWMRDTPHQEVIIKHSSWATSSKRIMREKNELLKQLQGKKQTSRIRRMITSSMGNPVTIRFYIGKESNYLNEICIEIKRDFLS